MKFKTLLFIFGVLVFIYPTISDWWNSYHQSLVIKSYRDESEQMKSEERDAFIEKAFEYNWALAQTGFLSCLSKEKKQEYHSVLNMYKDGLMGYLEIPAIECRLPIYHGTEEAVLQTGAGHMEGTSFPVGGKDTHCILSGHRGLPSARLFTGLDRLKVGDIFAIHVLKEELWYQIYEIQIVLPEDTKSLKIEEGKELCTLVTCTPYGINSHRLLVRGQRMEKQTIMKEDNTKETNTEGEMEMRVSQMMKWAVLGFLIVLFWLSSSQKSHAESMGENDYEIEIQYEFADVEFKLYQYENGTAPNMDDFYKKMKSETDIFEKKEPVQKKKTNEKGHVFFDKLPKGEYIIVGGLHEENGEIYRPVPIKVSLPYGTDSSTRKVIIKPKYEKEQKESGEEKVPEKEEPGSQLPQTGQLWMPVVFLCFGSILCFVLYGIKRFL